MPLDCILNRIAQQLLINASFTQNIGLSCGKCGVWAVKRNVQC